MDRIRVRGGNRLEGELRISGAKNSALKLMAASLLTDEPVTLMNVPRLSDIKTLIELLRSLGTEVAALQEGAVLALSTQNLASHRADYDIVRKMRASFNVLGPLVARNKHAVVSLPGGCAIGARPVDLHLKGLEQMGVEIALEDGYVHATAPNGVQGADITFPLVSVGATENILTAATLANGTTVIRNAACEPEIVDLADCLNKMGAKITGAGTNTITIEGVEKLHGCTHSVVMDRIALGSYMLAPAIAGGDVVFLDADPALLTTFIAKMRAAGVEVIEETNGIRVRRNGGPIKPVDVRTEPHPGFATDLQAQMMALMLFSDGACDMEETIFENRFMHAPELARMGAKINVVHGGHAKVEGVKTLRGAPVMATDLRASFSLILAGLAAEGETIVRRVYHLDRGYEHVVRNFKAIGADVVREKDE